MRRLLLQSGSAALLLMTLPRLATADSEQHPTLKRKFNLPPSVDLNYTIDARQSGLQIQGSALVQWRNNAQSYSVTAETRAMLVGKILDAKSEGAIDAYGLAPARFTEKRFRKDPTSTTFDRAARTITFAQSDLSYPLAGGEQDRTSITWQLVAIVRAMPKKFTRGSEWAFFVAGQRDAERWTFKVIGPEKIRTPTGDLATLHLMRAPPPDAQSQKLDLWLAPGLEWYPVKLRFTDADGEYIEQTLQDYRKP